MRSIAWFTFVLFTLLTRPAAARFSPDNEARIRYREKISGKPLATIDHAFARVTLAEFMAHSNLMGPADNAQNVVNVEFSTGNLVLPRVYLMHMQELDWIATKRKIVSYILVKADVEQYGGTPQEQHALRQIAQRIADFWGEGCLRKQCTLHKIESRAGLVPAQTDGPLGALRDVFSLSIQIEFVAGKVEFPLFTHERMVMVLLNHYRKPTTVTVSLNNMPTKVLHDYPFLVEDLTILRR